MPVSGFSKLSVYRHRLLLILLVLPIVLSAQTPGTVIRLDPSMDSLVPRDAQIETVVQGFRFVEGPVWIKRDNTLVFSDIPGNKIYKWDPVSAEVSVVLDPSGFTGADASGVGREVNEGGEIFYNIGSNGVTVDAEGRLVFNAMGDRQVVRLEADGKRTVLASQFEGKRLNSGNDLVYRRDGTLYFTDPPSGLRGSDEDPDKQMDYNGVFMLKGGVLHLLTKDIFHPNGIAFSHDETVLYVNDNRTRQITAFDVRDDGTIHNPRIFVDMTADKAEGNPDGMKVDMAGNMYAAGAGGVWVINPQGKLLGKIVLPERASNLAFGDADGKTLYMTARTRIYRIRLLQAGPLP
jgi:gluconolactonase